jgi:hypothetical protein
MVMTGSVGVSKQMLHSKAEFPSLPLPLLAPLAAAPPADELLYADYGADETDSSW